MMPFGYLRIELLRMLRNKRYIIFVGAFPVIFYMINANLWGTQTIEGGVKADVFLMVSMGAYGALAASMMSTAVPWAQERQSGWLRQLQVTPLPNATIILTKLVSALMLVLPALLLVILAAVLTQGVSLTAGQWAALIPAMWLGTIPFAALGLVIGSLLPVDTAQPVAMLSMFALALLGGLWFPPEVMPATMKEIADVLPSFSYADIGWHLVSGEAVPPSDAVKVVIWAVVLGALAVFGYRRAVTRA
ncbi:ABC transporter permease [Planobispora takensis]|nr:ABC transporter permease [Planobispora takensis]